MGLRGGIDLGGTKIQAIVVEGDEDVRGQARQPTPTDGGPQEVVAAMAEALREAADDAGVDPGDLEGVGIGSPGVVDDEAGTVGQAKNLPAWEGTFDVRSALGEALGTTIRLGNDVRVSVDAEVLLGAGRGRRSLLGVFWGTGVGGAVVLNGLPWRGRGAAGEIGHVVVQQGGARCGCGRLGCMEAYAGRAMMERHARELHEAGRATDLFHLMEKHEKPRLTSGIWERAIDHGDELAIELFGRAVSAIATAAASVVNVLDVEAVVLGGGLGVRFGEPLAERLLVEMGPHLFRDDRPPEVVVAEKGDLGGALGAALLLGT